MTTQSGEAFNWLNPLRQVRLLPLIAVVPKGVPGKAPKESTQGHHSILLFLGLVHDVTMVRQRLSGNPLILGLVNAQAVWGDRGGKWIILVAAQQELIGLTCTRAVSGEGLTSPLTKAGSGNSSNVQLSRNFIPGRRELP